MIENRTKYLTLRVTESQRDLVRAAARKAGKRVSQFVRDQALSAARRVIVSETKTEDEQ